MAGSISVCAPNWTPDVVRLSCNSAIEVCEFRGWLEEIGFSGAESDCVLSRPPEEVYVHEVDGEVAFVTFEFPPVDDALDRLERWEKLLASACDRWAFAMIGHDGKSTVPLESFRSLLTQDTTWQVIAKANAWPPID